MRDALRARRLAGPLLLLATGVCVAAETPPARDAASAREVVPQRRTFAEVLTRLFSPKLREMDLQAAELRRALADLPRPPARRQSERLGYHSPLFPLPVERQVSIQIDLQEAVPVEGIALVPAEARVAGETLAGYGFPRRFRIEGAAGDGAPMKTLVDQTASDYLNPANFPYWVELPKTSVRTVRVTATRLYAAQGRCFLALGEIVVLASHRNVALGKPVTVSDPFEDEPTWSASNLVDAQSVLGIPVTVEKSSTSGYHSGPAASADEPKWVQVDLGRRYKLDEIRLVPSRPLDGPPDRPNYGFPPRFRVDVSDDEQLTARAFSFDRTGSDAPMPGDNPVVVPLPAIEGRFVRVTATRLHRRPAIGPDQAVSYVFSLAELQVFSAGRNVALGTRVTAKDTAGGDARPAGYSGTEKQSGSLAALAPDSSGTEKQSGSLAALAPDWNPRFLVDGFSSERRLDDWAGWLRQLARRRDVERVLGRLVWVERPLLTDAVLSLVARVAVGAGSTMGLVAVVLLWRVRAQSRRRLDRLRTQIARDLHDDIGSNLASIALLSEVSQRPGYDPAAATDDLAEINRIARETNESIHDIVWLTDSGQTTPEDLFRRMRSVAETMLGGALARFEGPTHFPARALSLGTRRHLLLMFKEILHNVSKHAEARKVLIDVAAPRGGIRLEVRDDGKGFDPDAATDGHGLANLRQRAALLHGSLTIQSQPGEGCAILFEGPLS